jgi:hypothetical protein
VNEESAGPSPQDTPAVAAAELVPDTPAPEYAAPPAGHALPLTVGARRNTWAVVTGVVVCVVVVVGLLGYGIVGYNFATSRIDSARSTYNSVIVHQNTITEEFNNINTKLTTVNLTSSSAADITVNRATFVQLVSQSQVAQPTITADDTTLAAAQASLKDKAWLTLFNRTGLDQMSSRIEHERNALASAKKITADLLLLGQFFQAYDDAFIDLNTIDTKEQASDLPGAAAAIATLKTDIAKALALAGAPGLPPEMKQLLTDMQTLAVDDGKLLDAAIAGDVGASQAAVKLVQADVAKLESHNYDAIGSEIKAFYQPLVDTFNAEVAKANNA